MASLSDLDFNEIGEWPSAIKLVAILLICLILLGLGYYFIIKDKQFELTGLEQQEDTLKSEFEAKQLRATNLDAYKAQLEEIKGVFGEMLQQLPGKSEVADLLLDISRTGQENGLEFELFKPKSENPKDFYAELPIKMQVTGDYHQFGNFVSDIAILPRIVTLHNFSIEKLTEAEKKKEGEHLLKMVITAKTYRYFDDEELAEINTQAEGGR